MIDAKIKMAYRIVTISDTKLIPYEFAMAAAIFMDAYVEAEAMRRKFEWEQDSTLPTEHEDNFIYMDLVNPDDPCHNFTDDDWREEVRKGLSDE